MKMTFIFFLNGAGKTDQKMTHQILAQEKIKDSKDDLEPLSEELARLRLRRDELVKREESRQAQRDLLAQHVSTTLEVRPRILVPDTNAFVDHLEEIKKIALAGEYQFNIKVTYKYFFI